MNNITSFETPSGTRFACATALVAPREVLEDAAKAFAVTLLPTPDIDVYVLYAETQNGIEGFLEEVE